MKLIYIITLSALLVMILPIPYDARAGTLEFDGVSVDITTVENEDLVITPGDGGSTQIGDATTTSDYATTNDDLHVTRTLEVEGATYLESALTVTGVLTASSTFVATSGVTTDTITNSSADLTMGPSSGYGITGTVTRSASTGSEVAYDLATTVNKSTSGDLTGLKVNVTDTSSPGLLKVADLQIGSRSILQVYEDTDSANYARLSVGTGNWDGSSGGYFSGSANGTQIAVNAPSGFTGNLVDLQVAGSSMFTVNALGKLDVGGALIQKVITIADDDTTPDVSGGNIFITSGNTGATAITDLDNPTVGQTVIIVGVGGATASTIADSGNFNLSAAWTANLDDMLVLYVQADNDYVEVGRSDN